MSTGYIVLLLVLGNLPILWWSIKKKHLQVPYGVLAAGIIGAVLFLIHWLAWVALVTFFVTSSILTKVKKNSKEKQEVQELFEKGGERDPWQVLANGGVPLLISMYLLVANKELWMIDLFTPLVISLFTALAVVTADTWSTEIGVLSRKEPYFVLKPWKRIRRGASGGVSLQGTVAGLLGAGLIGIIPTLQALPHKGKLAFLGWISITLGGLLGDLVDSILGATIQGYYYCETCQKPTEKEIHGCGDRTTQLRGFAWFKNDLVNFVASLIGSICGYVLFKTIT